MTDAKGKGKGKGKGEPDDEPKPSKLPMLLSLVNLLATGAVGFLVFSAAGAGAEDAEEEPTGPPIVIQMDPFVVNLNEPTSRRYLKTTIEIEVKGEERQLAFEEKKRAIRSEILRYLSGLEIAQTVGEESKVKINDEIMTRFVKHLGEESVEGLYLTEFVVQ